MSAGLRHALAQEFHDWQMLGQGHTVWDLPVIPEPYFYPFFWHGALVEQPPLVDDGRSETLLSKMAGKLKSAFSAPAQPAETASTLEFLEPLKTGEAPGRIIDGREELFQASWLLPSDIEWNPKLWETLLYSLSGAAHPVCLEIVASDRQIHFRWIVDERDRDILEGAMEAMGMSIQPQEDPLVEWIRDNNIGYFWNGELALEKEFLFPIRSGFQSDPYEAILASLSRLGSDSIGMVQILFSPCRHPWAESIWRSVTQEDGQPFFAGGQQFLQAAKQKCAEPLYAANIRLAVLSSEPDDGEAIARRLARSFGCFEGANGFVLSDEIQMSAVDIVRRRFWRSGFILNASELFSLVHPPASGVGASAIQRMVTSTQQVPERHADGAGLTLGINEHAGDLRMCRISPKDRCRHMHVLGASGTGKSTFLLHSMLQDLEAGAGFALLDPHGDLVEEVLNRLPEHRIKDVVMFNPADADFPVGFNILRAHSDIEKNLLASDFVAIFERLSSSWGDQMTAVLGNAALAMLESDQGGTLMDLKRFLIEKGFRDSFLQTVKDPEIRYFWTREFPLLRGTTQASLLTRLNGFLRHRLVRNMVCQRGEKFDVAKMMDEGKIILAPLSQGLIGQENSWLLGSLLVSRFYQSALSRQSVDEDSRRPFYLYLDEAHHFVTPSIASILSGGRKYGLGMVLSHQSLDQFPSRESGILGSILSNCHTRVCFKLGDQDAARLESGFEHFDENDFRRLKTGEAICRIGGSDADFNLRTSPPPPIPSGAEDRRARAIALSRETYAKPREEVEQREAHHRQEEDFDDSPAPPAPHPPREKRPATPPISESPPPEPEIQVAQEPAPEPEEVAEEAPPPPKPARTPGRGGSRHKLIQQLIKQHANGLGLRATIEADLADKSGSVDVLLEGQSLKIAFEVADSSPLPQEAKNIAKALANGIENIVIVSDKREHLNAIKAEALSCGIPLSNSVVFLETADVGNHFCELGAKLASYETTSRGYKVKVRHAAISEREKEERLSAIHRAMAEHKKNL